jgi:UDP:flavonoid glycosyltransferase YjiC (YdhE family)
MGTALLTWELGTPDAVRSLVRVARALAERGHRPVLALHDVTEPAPLLAREKWPILPAPHCRTGERSGTFASYADLLAARGWDREENLRPLVGAWEQLFAVLRAQVVVAHASPTACLAAFGAVPVVSLGSGFHLPPAVEGAFPNLAPDKASAARQERLRSVVHELQRQRGRAAPGALPELMAGSASFPLALPEVDPYRPLRREPTWDPLEAPPQPVPSPATTNYFAHLTVESAAAERAVFHLAQAGYRGTALLRQAPPDVVTRLRSAGLAVTVDPADGPALVGAAAVILHHGDGAMAQAALAAGRPQVLLPEDPEQMLTARLVQELGVGIALAGPAAPEAVLRALQQVAGERRFAERATAISRDIQARPRRDALPAILAACLRHL